jgi:hypothetical protein
MKMTGKAKEKGSSGPKKPRKGRTGKARRRR